MLIKKSSRWLIYVLKLAVLLLLCIWIVNRIDFSAFLVLVQGVQISTWAILFGFQIVIVCLLGVRLAVLSRIPLRSGISISFRAEFFRLTAPAQLGSDVYRILALSGTSKLTKSRATLTVFADRLIGFAVLVAFVAVTAVMSGLVTRFVQFWNTHSSVPDWPFFVGFLVVVALCGALTAVWFVRRPGFMQSVAEMIRSVWGQFTLQQFLVAAAASVAMFLVLGVIVGITMSDSAELNVVAALSVPPLVLLTTWLVPVTFAGIGVREVAGIAFYGFFGFESHQAIVFTVVPFVVALSMGLLGLCWLVWHSGRPKPAEQENPD